MSTNDRLKGEWSLRIARRLLDANAITRVIEPAIEDLRHETATAPRSLLVVARAYWGLWKAIVVCAAVESVTIARPSCSPSASGLPGTSPAVTRLAMSCNS